MLVSSILAISAVFAQGLAVWGFLKFVKSFGAYTESQQALTNALLYTHESNLALHASNIKILEELKKLHSTTQTRGVA